jgi:hypothetical protein
LALDLAAQLTRGELAGDLEGEPSSVIYITTEDGLDNVVRPRLQAMGADLDRVHTVGYHGDALDSLTDQIDDLARVIVESGARLIILDPLVSAMTDIDTFKPGPVRKALEPFIALLKRENVACVGVLHTNRGETRVALDRISESKAFTRIARAAIGFAPDPEDENYRVVGLMKSNQSSTKLALMRVKIESAKIMGDRGETIQTSRLVWCGEAEGSASEIFNPAPADDKEERDNVDRLLVELLTESPANNDAIVKALKGEGHSLGHKQIQRALKRVGATNTGKGGRGRPTEYQIVTPDS